METAVSTPEPELRPDGGRSNGAEPSLSSASNTCAAVVPLPVSEPHANFMAPHVRHRSCIRQSPERASALPVCLDLELRQGLDCYFTVLQRAVLRTSSSIASGRTLNPHQTCLHVPGPGITSRSCLANN